MGEPGGPGSTSQSGGSNPGFETALFIFTGCWEINDSGGTEVQMGREEGKRETERERAKSLLRGEKEG